MPDAFDPEESYIDSTLLQKLETGPPVDKSVEKLATNLNKIVLETTSLNLSEHPALELLNLPEQSVFNNLTGFCHTVADTTNRPRVFCLLTKLVKYDITTHQKMTEQYAEWKSVGQTELAKQKKMQKEIDRRNKKLERTSQELDWASQNLDQTHQQLVDSREEYSGIQKELDRVQKELRSTQIQLTKERSMLGAQKQDKLIEKERA